MSVMIPILDTQHKHNDSELWHIIEEQRQIIHELQTTLNEITLERDTLRAQMNCTTTNKIPSTTTTSSSSSLSSFTEERSSHNASDSAPKPPPPPPSKPTNNKLPIPPPRSPYRSNTYIDTKKKKTDTRHSSLPNLQGDEVRDQHFDPEQDNFIHIQVNVKTIFTSSIVFSITNKKNGKEIWKVEKSYTDLLSMDIALKDHNKLELLFNNAQVDKRLLLFQDYFSTITLKDDVAFKSFCSFLCKNKIQREGYLTKRGKYNVGGGKKYYFIMNGSDLKYFYKHGNELYVGSVPFTRETRIGKQSTTTKKGDDDILFHHAFIVLHESAPAYKYILCAESDPERDEWVKVLHTQQCIIAKKPVMATGTKSFNAPNKSLNIPKVRTYRSNSDTSVRPCEKDVPIVVPTKIRQKTYQRSSLDDQAILRFLEANSTTWEKQQKRQEKDNYLLTKASADSLPSQLESNVKQKRSENRKTFWSRRKFFSVAAVEPGAPYNVESYSTSSVSTNNTALFQVFSVPLEEAIRLSKVSDNFELPAIVYRCIEYLEAKNAVHEEGIYRLSGSAVQITNLRQQFCEYGDVDILALNDHQIDVHVVAGLLKMWLRELPVNVLTNDLLNDFTSVIDMKDKEMRVKKLGQLVSMLPIANYSLLRTLIAHLIHIVHHAEQNKMTLRNVGIVFAPTLFIPSGVFTLLMSEFEYIFWVDDSKKPTKQKQQPPVVHPTIIRPKPSTSADRFKEQYLRAEELRSSRNSLLYKNNVPMSLISLENVINKDQQHRKDLTRAQEDIERNHEEEELDIELYYRL